MMLDFGYTVLFNRFNFGNKNKARKPTTLIFSNRGPRSQLRKVLTSHFEWNFLQPFFLYSLIHGGGSENCHF